MCDDFIHQGLTHDPTISRRAFGLGAAATRCWALPQLRRR